MSELFFSILETGVEIICNFLLWLVGLIPSIFHSILSIITGDIYYYDIYDYANMGIGLIIIFLLIVLLVLLLYLIYEMFSGIWQQKKIDLATNEIITEERVMIIRDKSYTPPSTSLMPVGKVLVPITSSAEYNVKLRDSNSYKIIDDSWIYNNYRVGDSINVIVEVRKDKYGKIVYEEILGAKEEY